MRSAVTALRLSIVGRVQGVGFRAWTVQEALQRHLRGWVRNRRDGSVEAVFAGTADAVSAMIEACRRGPSSARVDAVNDEAAVGDMLKLRRAGEPFSVLGTI